MAASFFGPMKTNVYIDGFNLYHRALQATPYKWLDLFKLCEAILPTHESTRYDISPLTFTLDPMTPTSREGNSPTFARFGPFRISPFTWEFLGPTREGCL